MKVIYALPRQSPDGAHKTCKIMKNLTNVSTKPSIDGQGHVEISNRRLSFELTNHEVKVGDFFNFFQPVTVKIAI